MQKSLYKVLTPTPHINSYGLMDMEDHDTTSSLGFYIQKQPLRSGHLDIRDKMPSGSTVHHKLVGQECYKPKPYLPESADHWDKGVCIN